MVVLFFLELGLWISFYISFNINIQYVVQSLPDCLQLENKRVISRGGQYFPHYNIEYLIAIISRFQYHNRCLWNTLKILCSILVVCPNHQISTAKSIQKHYREYSFLLTIGKGDGATRGLGLKSWDFVNVRSTHFPVEIIYLIAF